MNYYRTFLVTKNGGSSTRINESMVDIDTFYIGLLHQARLEYGSDNILHFDCIQLSVHSEQIMAYLSQKRSTAPPPLHYSKADIQVSFFKNDVNHRN